VFGYHRRNIITVSCLGFLIYGLVVLNQLISWFDLVDDINEGSRKNVGGVGGIIDIKVSRNIELGLSALSGEKGPAYDQILSNAGMVDHLLGAEGAADISVVLDRAGEAILYCH
ncbi:hypothetical protein RYX36_008182, partial [Vicia faba]